MMWAGNFARLLNIPPNEIDNMELESFNFWIDRAKEQADV